MIKLELIGRVGKDAELKQIGNYNYIAFSVAVTERRGTESTTTWIDVLKRAQDNGTLQNYIRKGGQVFIAGKPTLNAYTSNSGEVKASLTVWANEIELLGGNTEQSSAQQQPAQAQNYGMQSSAPQQQSQQSQPASDDLPF